MVGYETHTDIRPRLSLRICDVGFYLAIIIARLVSGYKLQR
jgi:hypothetical protein